VPRIIRIGLVIGLALGLMAPSIGAAGRTAASAATSPGVLPIGIPVNESTCDGSGEPTGTPWPSGATVVIQICGDPTGLTWLDYGEPGGGVAEVIADIDSPRPDLAVPAWIYAGEAFNPNNGNLEAALNDQAGNPLRVPMIDDSCNIDPGSGTDACESGPGSGSNLWVHAAFLRTFTIEAAHLTGDLSMCSSSGTTKCLIGTFSEAPFTDVDDNPFRADIEWAWAAGITDGCSPELFCPKQPVHRDQMATFLDRMFDLAATDADWFDDDNGNTQEAAINRVAAAGITVGCRTRAFCPNATVTREQMAAFISRAAGLTEGAGNDYFSDDDGRALEMSDDLVAAAGITNGCHAFRFCPTASVLREQMVAFLHRVGEPIEPPPFPAP
jgi:hypothetical protein